MRFLKILIKINLVVLAVDFFTTSIFGIFFPRQAIALYEVLYGTSIPATKEIFLFFKPWGTFGFFGGLATLLPLADRNRYKGVLFALFVFLLLRLFIRLYYLDQWMEIFSLSVWRNIAQAFLIAISAALVLAGAMITGDKKENTPLV